MWKTDMCCASFSSSVNVLLGLQIGHWINFRLFLSVGWGTWGSVWPTSAITWSLAMIVASRFAVVALAEKVTSSSSENRIPQSWSDLGEIISSFSTEGPVKGPEMGRWTPALVWIRLCSKSLSVMRSPLRPDLFTSANSFHLTRLMKLWYTKMTYSWAIISLVMDNFSTFFVLQHQKE